MRRIGIPSPISSPAGPAARALEIQPPAPASISAANDTSRILRRVRRGAGVRDSVLCLRFNLGLHESSAFPRTWSVRMWPDPPPRRVVIS